MNDDALKNPEVSGQFRKNDAYRENFERIFDREAMKAAMPGLVTFAPEGIDGIDFRALYESSVLDRSKLEDEVRRLNAELAAAGVREAEWRAKAEALEQLRRAGPSATPAEPAEASDPDAA